MYLYLGQNTVVKKTSVVAIFDMDNTTQSKTTMDFLRRAEKQKRLISVSDELPKSFVVYRENGKSMVYLSQMASATLLRRAESGIV